jgi:hypothetical protein
MAAKQASMAKAKPAVLAIHGGLWLIAVTD